MALQGKGFFLSEISECEGGDPSAILLAAQAAGLSHVLIKIAEGTQVCGLDATGLDLNLSVVQVLRTAGIAVWGWHAVTGDNPTEEATLAARRVRELALDGYALCVGAAYEQSGKAQAAEAFMTGTRTELGDLPIALSAYRFPNFHPGIPWAAFLEKCDAVMPQVYWEAAHDAGAQLKESLRQYRALPNARPCIPTGATYRTPDGWAPTQEEINAFLTTAKEAGIEAVSFFSWDSCRKHLPHLWDLIADFGWPTPNQAAVQLPLVWPTAAESQSAATSSQGWEYPSAGGGQPSDEAAVAGADDYTPAGGGQPGDEAAVAGADDYTPTGGGQPSHEAAVAGADDYTPAGGGQPSDEAAGAGADDYTPTGGGQPSDETAGAGADDYPPAGGGQPVTTVSQAEEIKARVSSLPVTPDVFTTQYLNALKSHQAAKVTVLYAEDAIHVRGDKVLKGAPVIRSGYSAFFYGLPAGATFKLLGVEVRGDIRYLAWKAGPLTAYESIILRNGVIVLEYTYIE